MAAISSARLQLQYAKAREAEGAHAEAAAAYEAAGGWRYALSTLALCNCPIGGPRGVQETGSVRWASLHRCLSKENRRGCGSVHR